MRNLTIGLIALFAFSSTLAADPKPSGSKPVSGQAIANMYVGKSQVWKSCRGGVYYGGGGKAEAFCNKESGSARVGVGQWTVTSKGTVCADMRWHWGKGEGKSKQNDAPDCMHHIVDETGQIWRRWNSDKDWWRLNADSLKKGNAFKGKTNRMKRKFGV